MLIPIGIHRAAGVDEAGRGPLAGPVVAAAVILNPEFLIEGLNDSKKLSSSKREVLFERIFESAISVGIGFAGPEEIDEMNILQATFLAMQRAVANLRVAPSEVWVDGNRSPVWSYRTQTLVKGDGKILEIAAASIVAKVTRDRHMQVLEERYPGYGFGKHAGYPTLAHREALKRLGLSPVHRRSFAPVRDLL